MLYASPRLSSGARSFTTVMAPMTNAASPISAAVRNPKSCTGESTIENRRTKAEKVSGPPTRRPRRPRRSAARPRSG